ncbi:lymphotoxin-alpha-like [Brachionichthys hirsutus]|uniref:lymphotoxin-alpha-like n=1 Tax=Brachionichthys hirsutus TaxID=412623 RepID=UPI0036052E65
MEEEGCCCCCRRCGGGGGGVGSRRGDAVIRFLKQNQSRLQRTAQVFGLALLLLISLVLAVLITVVNGGRGPRSPHSQVTLRTCGASRRVVNSDSHKNPSAMLTAARGENTESTGKYLKWESEKGHAFCNGGFSYSQGNLVVPRDGIYRVFLQITYEKKDNVSCETLSLINSVVYYRDTYPEDVTLLSSADTVSCSMEVWSKSLYASGLFNLEADGKLRVKASTPHLIIQREHEVFFGAELLPQ